MLIGGTGDDVPIFDALDTLRVDGGLGLDTLRFDGAGNLNLTIPVGGHRLAGVVYTGIEQIDLDNGAANTLTLSRLDVFQLSEESNTLTIFGDTSDTVNLTGFSMGTSDGMATPYTLGNATLLVDDDIGMVNV